MSERPSHPTTTAGLTCSLGVGVGVGAAGLWLALLLVLHPVWIQLPVPSLHLAHSTGAHHLCQRNSRISSLLLIRAQGPLKSKQNWGWGLGEMASPSTHYLFSSQGRQVSYCIWASLLGKTGWPRCSRVLYPSTRGCTWPHSAFCVCLEI